MTVFKLNKLANKAHFARGWIGICHGSRIVPTHESHHLEHDLRPPIPHNVILRFDPMLLLYGKTKKIPSHKTQLSSLSF